MLRLIVVLVALALTVYAVADAVQYPAAKPFGLRRWIWVAAIVLLPVVGPLAWLVVKFISGGEDKGARGGPLAPDDDPDYLRWLEQQRRRRST